MQATITINGLIAVILTISSMIQNSDGISCYQCHSRHDGTCPATGYFDVERNAVVNCDDPRESQVPGTSCIKITRKSQDTVGSPGWREEERRCATKADWGIAYGCRRYVTMENIETETCYCDTNNCNGASGLNVLSRQVYLLSTILITLWFIKALHQS